MRRLFSMSLVAVLCLVQVPVVMVLAQAPVSRLPLGEKFLEESLGTEWFGVYLKGKKIGYAQTTLSKGELQGKPIFQQSMHLKVKAKTSGVDFELDVKEELYFQNKAPYALLGGKLMHAQGTAKQQVTLAKTPKGFVSTTSTNGKSTSKEVDKVDYNLSDAMTGALWIQQSPKVGAKLTGLSFDFDKLKTDVEHMEILAIRQSRVKGVDITYYELEVEQPSQNVKMLQRLDNKGNMISGHIGGVFEMRKEPEEQAKNLEINTDLFVMGLVRIDKGLGDPSKVNIMIVELIGDEAKLLESGPWQTVTKGNDGKLICKVGKLHGKKMKATEKELAENLEATNSYPAKNERVVALAKQAIGDAKTSREKVEKLVKFVHDYIKPSYGGKGLVVLDLLDKKAGDCTAYAALFTTLARAAGIPAREVSGFAYMGDFQKAFGGHAWNEVVIDGHWHPIDASTGAVDVDAARVCFGSDNKGSVNFLKNFGSLSLRLIEVQHGN